MENLDELRVLLAVKLGEARTRHMLLPPYIKRIAKQLVHDVHPYRALAAQFPELREISTYADLLLEISELEGRLCDLEAARLGPPDLRLGKVRK